MEDDLTNRTLLPQLVHSGLDLIEERGLRGKLGPLQESLLTQVGKFPDRGNALRDAAVVCLFSLGLPHVALEWLEAAQSLTPGSADLEVLIQQSRAKAKTVPATAKRPHYGAEVRLLPPLRAKDVVKIMHRNFRQKSATFSTEGLEEIAAAIPDDELWRNAEEALEAGELLRTQVILEAALLRCFSREEALTIFLGLGGAFLQAYQAGDAVAVLELGRDSMPKCPEIWLSLGMAHQLGGQVADAFQDYQQVLKLEPENGLALTGLAMVCAMDQQWQQTADYAELALEVLPDCAEAWICMALVRVSQKNNEEAFHAAQKALAIGPTALHSWLELGAVFFDLGHDPEAEVCFQQVQGFQALDFLANIYLARLKIRREEVDEASRQLEALSRGDDVVVLLSAAWNEFLVFFLAAGHYERAAWAGRMAVRFDPMSFSAHANLGRCYHLAGNYADAQASYERALEIKPDSVEIRHNQGVIYSEMNEFRKAREYLQQIVTEQPDNSFALYDLGMVGTRTGRQEEAAACFDQAVQPHLSGQNHASEEPPVEASNRSILGWLSRKRKDLSGG